MSRNTGLDHFASFKLAKPVYNNYDFTKRDIIEIEMYYMPVYMNKHGIKKLFPLVKWGNQLAKYILRERLELFVDDAIVYLKSTDLVMKNIGEEILYDTYSDVYISLVSSIINSDTQTNLFNTLHLREEIRRFTADSLSKNGVIGNGIALEGWKVMKCLEKFESYKKNYLSDKPNIPFEQYFYKHLNQHSKYSGGKAKYDYVRIEYNTYSMLFGLKGLQDQTVLFEDDIDEQVFNLELVERLQDIVLLLNQREQKVINMRFGLIDGKPCTLQEIGIAIGVQQERVRQIEAKILRKLRNPKISKGLEVYL